MIVTVPVRRLDAARPGRQVCLLLRRGGGRPGRIGELVDDDVAVRRVLRQDRPGRPRAAQSPSSGDSAGRTGRLGVGQDEVVLARARATSSTRVWLTAGETVIAGSDRRDREGSAGHVGRRHSRPIDDRAPPRIASGEPVRASTPSSGRPVERAPTHQVDVEVVDGLAAPATDVRDEPVAAVGDALRCGRDRRRPRTADRAAARPPRSAPAADADVPPRDEQDVGRRARRDVAERDDQVVRRGARSAGISPATIRQNRQSTGGARHVVVRRHHSTGFELIRNPIVPTSPAIRYDT